MQESADRDAAAAIGHRSPAAEKVALFRSLFRGRDDVHSRRFENRRTGRTGYAPACGNEWLRGVCEKPRIKCADCAHRAFLPVTDEVIRWHLSGKDKTGADFTAGVYPMLRDETCRFLAIDFDKESSSNSITTASPFWCENGFPPTTEPGFSKCCEICEIALDSEKHAMHRCHPPIQPQPKPSARC